jgi:hypothetical protein
MRATLRNHSILAAGAVGLALLLAAPALAAQPGCARLFATYDRAVHDFSYSGWGERPLAPAISRAVQRLRQQGCVTGWDDVSLLPSLGVEIADSLQGEHGAPIRPTTLQVGIVEGIGLELDARRFFGELGYRVRSQGAPWLGRRIYLGPFTTEGGLAEAAAVAERSGFVAPYPRRF